MAADINSAELCLKAIQVLKEGLASAKKSLLNSDTCTVNRTLMQAQLEYLEDNLPDTVAKAAEIVEQEETIRKETENKRIEILENASAQAQNMVNEASQKAQQIMEQVNYEANSLMERANQESAACVEAAKAEANRIVDEAEKKAKQLVEEESIVRRDVTMEYVCTNYESAKDILQNIHDGPYRCLLKDLILTYDPDEGYSVLVDVTYFEYV